MASDPHEQVRAGYDVIAGEYLSRMQATSEESGVRAQARRLIDELRRRVSPGSRVVDLGCGAGVPMTKWLSKTFNVTGVDFSSNQLKLARENVPAAAFIESDMLEVGFEPSTLDAVTAFFSVIHIQREHHAELYAKVARWLKPGGVFLASLGKKAAAEDWDEDWLGARMFWSYHDPDFALQQIEHAGMQIDRSWLETVEDGIDGPETFLWVIASRPVTTNSG